MTNLPQTCIKFWTDMGWEFEPIYSMFIKGSSELHPKEAYEIYRKILKFSTIKGK